MCMCVCLYKQTKNKQVYIFIYANIRTYIYIYRYIYMSKYIHIRMYDLWPGQQLERGARRIYKSYQKGLLGFRVPSQNPNRGPLWYLETDTFISRKVVGLL